MGPRATGVTKRTKLPCLPQAEVGHNHSSPPILWSNSFDCLPVHHLSFQPGHVLSYMRSLPFLYQHCCCLSKDTWAELGQVVQCTRKQQGLTSSLQHSLSHTPGWWAMSTREREAFLYFAQKHYPSPRLCHRDSFCSARAPLFLVWTWVGSASCPLRPTITVN